MHIDYLEEGKTTKLFINNALIGFVDESKKLHILNNGISEEIAQINSRSEIPNIVRKHLRSKQPYEVRLSAIIRQALDEFGAARVNNRTELADFITKKIMQAAAKRT